MHLAAEGESSAAQDKMRALICAFTFALVLRVLSQYAIGILWVCTVSVLFVGTATNLVSRTGILGPGYMFWGTTAAWQLL